MRKSNTNQQQAHGKIQTPNNIRKRNMEEQRIIEPMQNVAKFMKHWTIIDPAAKLTVLSGSFKMDKNTSHVYSKDNPPNTPK
jgi:hypothetical protein